MRTTKHWILSILFLCTLLLPTAAALAECRVTSRSGENDNVTCANPADTDGIRTGAGNDILTVNADTTVSSPSGRNALDLGPGDDRVYQRGAVNSGQDAIQMGYGNDTLYNYGPVTATDDGLWCSPQAGQTCTMYNYGSVSAYNEAVDVVNTGGRFVLRNSGTLTSTAQEVVHLNGDGTYEITNDGTMRVGSRQVIEAYGGTLIFNNNNRMENRGNYAAIQCYHNNDTITNRGTITAAGGPTIAGAGGNDSIRHYSGSLTSTNSSSTRAVIEAGDGNDTITIRAAVTERGSGGAAIDAGRGSDSVIIEGGAINRLIDGDKIGSNGDTDTLTFRFTGTQSEIDAFRRAMNGKSPSGGSVIWRGNTYTWSGFEKIVLDLRVG